MGSFPSNLFFPDNPNRRARAEQLSDDCQNNQNDYKNAREALTQVLEPLHGKLDQVMKALGCQTLEEFDQKVLSTATGDALAEWEKVRTQYDTADMIECVIWTAAGIVALAGLAISTAMGIFSFGIGFVAGMAVTGIIDMVLATVGIIYDIIDGAIQRDKLRDAINQLFETRLKMKRTVYQAQAMMLIVPALNDWFDALIESGTVDQAKILASFERHKDHFTSNESQWTFYKTAQTLREMDQLRNSWMNEDPSWENLANNLDAAEASANTATALMSSRSRTAPSVYLGTKSVTPTHSPQIPLFANVHSGEQSLFMPAERALVPPPQAVQEYVVTTDSPTVSSNPWLHIPN
ncbi:hypothetical protein BV22DRAFT_120462 [Leucogyrophana mollusca]|uniref:Uncharacterized protein n=1 Tax=Leucogyrophana mollusca TaxID=85980 RepID=A0ACB8BUE4_9AGAM|nr:hypothetical protein BV22DRAFT_120462 [Leucogyrophana mollusca]